MSRVILTYEASGDFPFTEDEPIVRYFIAATPRTGSTYLALQLWQTGILGAPMEYLNLKHSSGMRDRLGDGNDERFWNALKKVRTSQNGVFGIKMFPANYIRIARNAPNLLKDIWFHKALFLTRRDRVQQAVSHYKAYFGGAWYSDSQEKRSVDYDFYRIARFYESARKNEDRWRRIFELMGVSPYTVVYEDFIESPRESVDSIIKYFGVDTPPAPMSGLMTTEIQRDETSYEWRDRFLEDVRKFGSGRLKAPGEELSV